MNKNQRLLKKVSLCLTMLLVLTISDVFGQEIRLRENLAKQKDLIQVSSSVEKVKICTNSNIKLNVLVTVRNLSDKPMVFCNSCMTDVGIFIGDSSDSLYQDKFRYDQSGFGSGRKFDLPNPSPNEKPFITVAPQSSFSFSVIPILLADEKPAVKSGKYMFVQFIDTWSDYIDLGENLRIKWMNEGLNFWIDPITTEPALLEIGNLKKENCGSK